MKKHNKHIERRMSKEELEVWYAKRKKTHVINPKTIYNRNKIKKEVKKIIKEDL